MTPRLAATVAATAVVLLLSAAFVTGCGEQDAAVDTVDRANQFYQDGNYAAALQLYAEAEGQHPKAPVIDFNRGNAFAKIYRFETAVEFYTAAAAAAATEDPVLGSKIQYNLGVVNYQEALDALQTFQDAMGYTQAAIRHWRESLALQPGLEDARYNLELAYRLAAEIEAQRVQAQRNAETRNQKTSDNRGQAFADEEERASNELSDRDAEPTAGSNAEAGQGQSGQKAAAPTRQMGQMQEAGQQEDLTPAAAEKLLELMRQRALAAQNQRQAEQQVRIRTGRQDKFW